MVFDVFGCDVFAVFPGVVLVVELLEAFGAVVPEVLLLVLALGGRSFCIAAVFVPFAVAATGCAATTPGPLKAPGLGVAATAGVP